jgi:hypothetical protein
MQCVLCEQATATLRARHGTLPELPFCGQECSDAFCRVLCIGPKRDATESPEGSSTEEKRARQAEKGLQATLEALAPDRLALLPDEVLLLLLLKLPLLDLINQLRVDKRARSVAQDTALWKPLYDAIVRPWLPSDHMEKRGTPFWQQELMAHLWQRDILVRDHSTRRMLRYIPLRSKGLPHILPPHEGDKCMLLYRVDMIMDIMRRTLRAPAYQFPEGIDHEGTWYQLPDPPIYDPTLPLGEMQGGFEFAGPRVNPVAFPRHKIIEDAYRRDFRPQIQIIEGHAPLRSMTNKAYLVLKETAGICTYEYVSPHKGKPREQLRALGWTPFGAENLVRMLAALTNHHPRGIEQMLNHRPTGPNTPVLRHLEFSLATDHSQQFSQLGAWPVNMPFVGKIVAHFMGPDPAALEAMPAPDPQEGARLIRLGQRWSRALKEAPAVELLAVTGTRTGHIESDRLSHTLHLHFTPSEPILRQQGDYSTSWHHHGFTSRLNDLQSPRAHAGEFSPVGMDLTVVYGTQFGAAAVSDLMTWCALAVRDSLIGQLNARYGAWLTQRLQLEQPADLRPTDVTSAERINYTLYRYPESQTLAMVEFVGDSALYSTWRGAEDHIAKQIH